jgi:lipopolysaccharide export system protein LptA
MIPRRAAARLLFLAALPVGAPGAEPPPPASAATAAPAAPLVPTVIESGALDMVSTEKETTFTYSQGVKVTATNLTMTCENLVVIARRTGDPTALVGKQEKFKSLVATGSVRIVQNDREATADRAEVFPDDDKVVLTGNPVVVRSVKDGWMQTGQEAILLRGERQAHMPTKDGIRPVTTMPSLKDLGYDKVPEKKKKPAPAAPTPAAPKADSSSPTVTVPLPPPTK